MAGSLSCGIAGRRDPGAPPARRNRLTRTVARRSATVDKRGSVVVVVRNSLRTDDGLEEAERAQRNHAATGITDIEPAKICRRRPRILVGLQGDAEGTSEQVEVVHVKGSEEYLQSIEHVRHVKPEQFRLGAVEVVFELWRRR